MTRHALAMLVVLFGLPRVADAQPVEFGEAPSSEGGAIAPEEALDSRDVVLMASRRVQTIQEAPMIITIITREDIRRGGFRTVEEIIRTIPGFETTVYQNGRHSQILSRGQTRSLLFLLNGVPFYTFVYNTPYDLERTLDVAMIEKIEVVSGPGGVLWGANALLGIVNVITRDAPRDGSAHEFTVGGGDGRGERQTLRGFARTSAHLSDWGSANLMLSYVQTEGPRLTLDDSSYSGAGPVVWDQNLTTFGNKGTTENVGTSRYASAMLNLTAGDFSLYGYVPWNRRYYDISAGGDIIAGTSLEQDLEANMERFEPAVYLRFKRRLLGDRLGVQVTGSMQVHNFFQRPDDHNPCDACGFALQAPNPDIAAAPPGGLSFSVRSWTRRTGLSMEFDASLPAHNQLVWGLDLYEEYGHKFFTDFLPSQLPQNEVVPRTYRTALTGFIRDEWRIVPSLAIGAGVRGVGGLLRVDSSTDSAGNSYPGRSDSTEPILLTEAAAVWNIQRRLYARAAWAEGFRTPADEACCSRQTAGAFGGNLALENEKSRAIEGELNWITLEDVGPIDKLYLRLDYSYTELEGIIEVTSGQYYNRGNQSVHSVEFLSRLDLTNRSTISLAYYYLRAVDDNRGPLRFPANHILNVGLAYHLLPWLDLSTILTVVGPREDPNRLADRAANVATMNALFVEKLDPYVLWRPGLVVHDVPVSVLRDFQLRVFADNVLDQRWYTPDTSGNDKIEPFANLRPGIAVFADLTYRIGGGEVGQ